MVHQPLHMRPKKHTGRLGQKHQAAPGVSTSSSVSGNASNQPPCSSSGSAMARCHVFLPEREGPFASRTTSRGTRETYFPRALPVTM